MSQSELARRMGRPVKTINEIVNGKAAITPDTALQLELTLGISATFWNNLEAAYREHLARERAPRGVRGERGVGRRLPGQGAGRTQPDRARQEQGRDPRLTLAVLRHEQPERVGESLARTRRLLPRIAGIRVLSARGRRMAAVGRTRGGRHRNGPFRRSPASGGSGRDSRSHPARAVGRRHSPTFTGSSRPLALRSWSPRRWARRVSVEQPAGCRRTKRSSNSASATRPTITSGSASSTRGVISSGGSEPTSSTPRDDDPEQGRAGCGSIRARHAHPARRLGGSLEAGSVTEQAVREFREATGHRARDRRRPPPAREAPSAVPPEQPQEADPTCASSRGIAAGRWQSFPTTWQQICAWSSAAPPLVRPQPAAATTTRVPATSSGRS